MCLSELGRGCHCPFQTTLWLQKKWELLWYGVIFHCSNKANYVTSVFFYFIFTPVSLLLLLPILFSATSWLCSLWVNFSFSMCFLPNQNSAWTRNTEQHLVGGHSWVCTGPSPLQKPLINAPLRPILPDTHVSHLHYSHLHSVSFPGMFWHHHFAILNVPHVVTLWAAAAKLMYKCQCSRVLPNPSSTWERRFSAVVGGCPNSSRRKKIHRLS